MELISRQALHHELVVEMVKCIRMSEETKGSMAERVLNKVDEAPTIEAADVAEVVRCRECKHYHANTGWCNQLSYFQNSDGEPCSPAESMEWKMFMEDDFCSYGQRKETAHD